MAKNTDGKLMIPTNAVNCWNRSLPLLVTGFCPLKIAAPNDNIPNALSAAKNSRIAIVTSVAYTNITGLPIEKPSTDTTPTGSERDPCDIRFSTSS